MMILLDTHYLIWTLEGDPRLNTNVLALVKDPGVPIHISLASYWEIAIKMSLDKFRIRSGFEKLVERTRELGISELPITMEHTRLVKNLPMHHRDPFDRMLIAQAQHEGMHLLTADPYFKLYDVPLVDIWAKQ